MITHCRFPACVLIALLSCCSTIQALDLVVSPDGRDTNPGTSARPFRTLRRAQQAVRDHKARGGLTNPVNVALRGGTYALDAPLVFTPADSGTAECPVTYHSWPGETAVISGGRRIREFTRVGRFWETTLVDVKAGKRGFNQLYVNGHRRSRARTPNDGAYFRVHSALSGKDAKSGFRYKRGDVNQWPDLDDALFVVYASWYNTQHHVESLDAAARVVRFTNKPGRPFSWYEKNLRYYVENIAEALDAPGEWHLNRQTGVLRYCPLPGEEIATAQIVAPVVSQTLVHFRGEPGLGLYVEHVHLKGLQIRHTDAHLPKDLYDARQAATVQNAGILADGARYCSIDSCEVSNMGEHGIWFRDDCHHNVARRCHVHDLGGGGIYVGEKWRWGGGCPGWPGYKKLEDIPHTTEHNIVDNCFVHDGCYLFTGSIGVWIGQASHTTVSQNEICDMSYSGISLGWDWSGHPSTCHDNLIEYNHIHHLGHRRMNDMAGIYTLGLSPGTVLRNNLIHDVTAYQSPVGYCLGSGIYLDQSSGDMLIENNVCYNIDNAGFFLHYGTNNRLTNNVFAATRGLGRLGWGTYFTARKGKADKGNSATHNIVTTPTGKLGKATCTGGKNRGDDYEFVKMGKNVYFCPDPEPPKFSKSHSDSEENIVSFAEWQALGRDRDSLFADPLFVDANAHDYRLQPGSPARKLGIVSIDTTKAGLYGESAWVELPKQTRFRELDKSTPFEARVLLFLDEDFEDEPVGHVPAHAQFLDKEKGAVVDLTDVVASGGAKCLRFADAPGLDQPYFPNRVWRNFRVPTGSVTLRFDCMNSREKPATFQVELRDWTSRPFKAGPTLLFSPEGSVKVGRDLHLPCEPGRWYQVEISFDLGDKAPRTYQLRFGPKGEVVEPVTVPHLSDEFKILTWLGFIAMDSDRHAEFFVDNLHVDME